VPSIFLRFCSRRISPDPSSAPSAQLKLKNAPTLTLFAKSKVRKRIAAANNDPNAAPSVFMP
jgi:hypothetical protein